MLHSLLRLLSRGLCRRWQLLANSAAAAAFRTCRVCILSDGLVAVTVNGKGKIKDEPFVCCSQDSLEGPGGSWKMEEVAACQALTTGLSLSLDWAPPHQNSLLVSHPASLQHDQLPSAHGKGVPSGPLPGHELIAVSGSACSVSLVQVGMTHLLCVLVQMGMIRLLCVQGACECQGRPAGIVALSGGQEHGQL